MAANAHITAKCTIKSGKVSKDGKVLFEQAGVNAEQLFAVIYKHLDITYPKFYKMDSLSKLGFLTAEILLNGSFDKTRYAPEEVGVILSNASSSMDADIKYWESAKDIASPALFVYTLPNIVIGEICIRNGFKGEHALYIAPDFDAAFIHQQVKYLLDNNILKACICGWVEVLDEDYNATLFWVESEADGVSFEAGNLTYASV